jgi:uncharacterized protein YciI
MSRVFAVLLKRGEQYDPSLTLAHQKQWTEHAAFMDAGFEEGFFLLVGPLEGTNTVLQIVRAENAEQIERRLSGDPWMGTQLVVTQIAPWLLRLGSLG